MQTGSRLWPLYPKPNARNRECQDRHRREQKLGPRFFRNFAALERAKIAIHFGGRFVTSLRIVGARLDQYLVELKQLLAIGSLAQLRIDLRKIEPVFPGTGFVKKLAEAVNVSLRSPRTFRRHVAFRPDD